jgi:succinyl-CoA:(S)-malate CoA-transferase subunit A
MSQDTQDSSVDEIQPGAVKARTEDPTRQGGKQPAEEAKELPLEGLRVVDVGNFVAGPYAASILSEFGSEVYKVEYPIAGDPMRGLGTPSRRSDSTLFWLSEARNRKSVTINLRQPTGAKLFRKLVAKCDVLVESFRPGTMESWGVG